MAYWAVDSRYISEEYKLGQRAIAAPIFDKHGRVTAAASIVVPSACSAKDELNSLAEAVKNCARELSQAIKQQD